MAGRVKTRLAKGIGVVAATRYYRASVAALLARVTRPGAWTTVLAVTPDPQQSTPTLPGHLPRRRQGRGDLGTRLQRIMDELPPGPVVVIGSDVPQIEARHVAEAFRRLAGCDAVIGPSPDGGYWLIGLRRRPRRRRIFGGVRWSSAHARADTMSNLEGAAVRLLPVLGDVDEAADLAAHRSRLGRRILPR